MSGAHSHRPWLDADLSTERRVELLMTEMSIEDKVGQTHQVANLHPIEDAHLLTAGSIGSSLFASGATGGNERDGGVLAANIDHAQRHAVEDSRLGIPVLFARDVIHGHRTVCPIPLGLAASWDEGLVEEVARVAAQEAVRDGVAWTFAPMVDLSEEPRWGRVAESFGESPVLSGRLAAAMVRGFQGDDLGARDRISSCAKHFAGYGLSAGGRDYDTVSVGENTLRNLHLRPFREAVRAGVRTVMAGFNDADGIPMHAHRHLLREVLKGEWGFSGVVVADWNGIGQLVNQGVAENLRDAARQAIEAGVDLDMAAGAYAAHLADLVATGEVDVELVDDAVRRVLTLKFDLGLFERPYVGDDAGAPAPTSETRQVALRAAEAAHVLVSNNGVLPLNLNEGRVHLTGPFVHAGEELLGTWTLDGRGEDVITPAQALGERLGDRLLVTDGRFSDRAAQQVRNADVTVAVVGEHPWRSGEANSVTDIGLPAGQVEYVRQLARIGKPLVVVVYAGRPLELEPILAVADAVLLVWHPGVEAGTAFARILGGEQSPYGRLPMTFPLTTGHIPTSTHQRPTGRLIEPHEDGTHGRYLDDLVYPRLPFGHGLTYTTFEYSSLRATGGVELRRDDGRIEVEVDVTNTGPRPGREIVQLSFRDPVAEVTRPLTELLDWCPVDLQPGEVGTARFTVSAAQFAYFGRDNRERVDLGDIVLTAGPDALHGESLTVRVVD